MCRTWSVAVVEGLRRLVRDGRSVPRPRQGDDRGSHRPRSSRPFAHRPAESRMDVSGDIGRVRRDARLARRGSRPSWSLAPGRSQRRPDTPHGSRQLADLALRSPLRSAAPPARPGPHVLRVFATAAGRRRRARPLVAALEPRLHWEFRAFTLPDQFVGVCPNRRCAVAPTRCLPRPIRTGAVSDHADDAHAYVVRSETKGTIGRCSRHPASPFRPCCVPPDGARRRRRRWIGVSLHEIRSAQVLTTGIRLRTVEDRSDLLQSHDQGLGRCLIVQARRPNNGRKPANDNSL